MKVADKLNKAAKIYRFIMGTYNVPTRDRMLTTIREAGYKWDKKTEEWVRKV